MGSREVCTLWWVVVAVASAVNRTKTACWFSPSLSQYTNRVFLEDIQTLAPTSKFPFFILCYIYITTEFPLKMLFCFYKAGNFVISLAATTFQGSLCSLKFMVGNFVNNLHRCHIMLENSVFIYSQLSY